MYDFLLQEEWWMETIISSCITAVVAILIAYLGYADKLREIAENVRRLKERMDEGNNKLSGEHGKLSGEHGKLSGEHGKLSGEHKELSKEHRDLKDEIHKVITYQESEKMARQLAAKNIPDEGKLVDLIKIVYDNHERLMLENAKLNSRIAVLQRENAKLKAQILFYQQAKEDNENLQDMDLFDEMGQADELEP